MKQQHTKKALLLIVVAVASFSLNAQVVVKVRPASAAVVVRPTCPSPKHVWVGGNYSWRGNQYVYTNGYWALPPHHGSRWIDGHWKHRRGGWVWVPGHWRKF
jgi:hypothetical protein